MRREGVTAQDFDAASVRAKYLEERDKRLVAGRADIRELDTDTHFAAFRQDPFTPVEDREPVIDEVDVVVVGGGIAGVLAGANLRRAGVERIRIIDQAGGIGGTWYWNQYPGVMCDVESYIYMPMLEELDYIPTQRYAKGEEIRGHLDAVAEKFHLKDDALFHTRVAGVEWLEDRSRWSVRTDRGDVIACRWYVLATGILNLMKLPRIEGMESFAGRSFHTARWDYEYTGGSSTEPLDRLAGKTVALDRNRERRESSAWHRWPNRPSTSMSFSARRRPWASGATVRRTPDSPNVSSPTGNKTGWTTFKPSFWARRSSPTWSMTGGPTTTRSCANSPETGRA